MLESWASFSIRSCRGRSQAPSLRVRPKQGWQAYQGGDCWQVWFICGQPGHRFWWGLSTTWRVLSCRQRNPRFSKNNLFLQRLVSREIVCATETGIRNFLRREETTKTIPSPLLLWGTGGKLCFWGTTNQYTCVCRFTLCIMYNMVCLFLYLSSGWGYDVKDRDPQLILTGKT